MASDRLQIMVVIGTRAELIKMFPVLHQIEQRGHDCCFVHTGQHRLDDLCDRFGLDAPDIVLSDEPDASSKFNRNILSAIGWNLRLLFRFRKVIQREKPDYILYHGDTMSTALAAAAGSRFSFPIRSFRTGHVEAGLRSGSIREPFPEELSRRFADIVSSILFTVSPTATSNVSRLSMLGKTIIETGNTVIDSVNDILEHGEPSEHEGPYGIVTLHRHENIATRKRLEKIVSILEDSPRPLLFPMHDNTREALKEFGLYERVAANDDITIMDLVDYPDFLHLLKNADIIYTDGGSIQEESIIFDVPCVILRNRTERKEGLKTGIQLLSRFDVEGTIEKARGLINDHEDVENPYGEPGVSRAIIEALESDHEARSG